VPQASDLASAKDDLRSGFIFTITQDSLRVNSIQIFHFIEQFLQLLADVIVRICLDFQKGPEGIFKVEQVVLIIGNGIFTVSYPAYFRNYMSGNFFTDQLFHKCSEIHIGKTLSISRQDNGYFE